MGKYKTRALTEKEFTEIIQVVRAGFVDSKGRMIKPNRRVATALVLQANLGLRIGDIMELRLTDIIMESGRHRLNIVEQKTQKRREFSVPAEVFSFLQGYAIDEGIKSNQLLFPVSARHVQRHLGKVAAHLGLERVSTHSFRKFFAVSIYNSNGYNIELVRHLLQHSSVAVTQRYLSVQPELVEQALAGHVKLPA